MRYTKYTQKQWNCVKNPYLKNKTPSQTLYNIKVSDGQNFCFSAEPAGTQCGWEWGGSYHYLHSQTCHYRVLWLSTISTPCNMVLFGKRPLRRHRPFGVKMNYNTSRTPSNVERYSERCYALLYLDWHVFAQCQSLLLFYHGVFFKHGGYTIFFKKNKQSNRTSSNNH